MKRGYLSSIVAPDRRRRRKLVWRVDRYAGGSQAKSSRGSAGLSKLEEGYFQALNEPATALPPPRRSLPISDKVRSARAEKAAFRQGCVQGVDVAAAEADAALDASEGRQEVERVVGECSKQVLDDDIVEIRRTENARCQDKAESDRGDV